MSNENIKTWPEKVWMQGSDGDGGTCNREDYLGEEVTWCQDCIESGDIEYTRSDLVEQMQIESIRAALDAIRLEFDPISAHFAGHILDRINPATILQSLKEKS